MNFLNKMERKIGKYAIPNLMIYLIAAYCIGFVIYTVNPNFMLMLKPLSYSSWTGVETDYLDSDANRHQSILTADYGTSLLSAWFCTGTELGHIPF